MAKSGNFLTPIFRDSIPKLSNARCEHIHALKTSTWFHRYMAKSGSEQFGCGTPGNRMYAFKRNKLAYVEISYDQLDGTMYTLRTGCIDGGKYWRDFVVSIWEGLMHVGDMEVQTNKDKGYRKYLDTMKQQFRKDGSAIFPGSIRKVFHELQDHFGEPRTTFAPLI